MLNPAQSSPTEPTRQPRLKKLVIHRFRNVVPGTTLLFDNTFNVLVGKNGVGKSTLLRLLEGLLTGNDALLGATPLHADYEIELGDDRLSVSIELNCGVWRPPTRVSTDAQVAQEEYPIVPADIRLSGKLEGPGVPLLEWSYAAPSPTFNVSVGGVPTATRPPAGQAFNFYTSPFPLAVRVAVTQQTPPPHLAFARLLPFFDLNSIRRFDEALATFQSLFGWSAVLRTTSASSGRSISAAKPFDWTNMEVVKGLLSCDLDEAREKGFVRWSSAKDPVLMEFQGHARVGDMSLDVPLNAVDVTPDGTSYELGPCRVRVTRPDGTLFFHDDLSFGQKRFLAFLYIVNRGSFIVLADELSNGMHRAWIDLAVKKLRDRQSFIAAQNPLILDRIGFANAQQMQQSVIFCREDQGHFVWENAPVEEMRDVFRAYDVGLQHMSDVLWQKGLW